MAAQTFIRWSRLGVWDRLLALVRERGVQLGMTFLDGASIRAHHKAAGAAKTALLQHNEAVVKHLAARVAAMGPSPLGDPSAKQPVAEPLEGLAGLFEVVDTRTIYDAVRIKDFVPHVFSLSESGESLSQWRAYNGGEVCIEFDAVKLVQATSSRLVKIDYELHHEISQFAVSKLMNVFRRRLDLYIS